MKFFNFLRRLWAPRVSKEGVSTTPKYKRYRITWECERCHISDARDEAYLCADPDCMADAHSFVVRCDCGQRARFGLRNHDAVIAGRDLPNGAIWPLSGLPHEIH